MSDPGMVRPQFLRVRNWERFQHYKDRRPPGIKFHTAILDDHALLSLPAITQLVYDRMLLRAAVTDNNIEHDPEWLGQKFNLPPKEIQRSIETLVDAGFLQVAGVKRSASKAIARRKQNGVPKAEAETEKKEPRAHARPNQKPRNLVALPAVLDRCPECEIGAGYHTTDCSRAPKAARDG